MTYPHDSLLRAWLDGKPIQYLQDGLWVDIEPASTASKTPHLYRTGTEYRLKPVTLRYRVALMTNGAEIVNTLLDEKYLVSHHNFVRWLTDWIEVTV